ncbi:tetratricopeptide repeat protein [Streptomyces sp. MN13]
MELLERVAADRERLLGTDHPDTVAAARALVAWKPVGGSGQLLG